MTPFRLPWCQNKFLFGVYFLSCSHFDQKTFKAKKCYHGHRSTFNSNHLSVIYMHSHSLLQDQIHFWILSLFFVLFFLFCHDSIYLYLSCVFIVSLHSCPFNRFVFICAAVENCYWWCMRGFHEPALSSSLIWHVSTSCQMSRGGSPNVNVWTATGTIICGDLKPSEGSTLELCTLLMLSSVT